MLFSTEDHSSLLKSNAGGESYNFRRVYKEHRYTYRLQDSKRAKADTIDMEQIYTIYKITNMLNGKAYIGFTSKNPPEERWKQHILIAETTDRKDRRYIHKAIFKYGKDNFKFEVVYQNVCYKTCIENESIFIKEYNTLAPHGYNLTSGGDGSYAISESTKNLHSIQSKEMWKNEHVRKRITNSLKETCNTKLFKERQSQIMRDVWADSNYKRRLNKTFNNPELKKKMSDISKELWKEPSFRKRGTEAQCKYLYEVIYPNGQTEIVKNLKQFCREHSLHDTAAYQVILGKARHHKGFKFKKPSGEE